MMTLECGHIMAVLRGEIGSTDSRMSESRGQEKEPCRRTETEDQASQSCWLLCPQTAWYGSSQQSLTYGIAVQSISRGKSRGRKRGRDKKKRAGTTGQESKNSAEGIEEERMLLRKHSWISLKTGVWDINPNKKALCFDRFSAPVPARALCIPSRQGCFQLQRRESCNLKPKLKKRNPACY